jgi:hypothetical protein
MKIPEHRLSIPENEIAFCWRMAIATVMEIDPREVPEIDTPDWFERYQAWAESRGWEMRDWCLCEKCKAGAPSALTGIVSVDCGSDRFEHSIVVDDGKLFYDPANAGRHYFDSEWKRFTRIEQVPQFVN